MKRIFLTLAGAALLIAAVEAEAQDGRGWLGISFRTPAAAAGGPLIVESTYPESPAQRAGVQAGDTIVRWNGDADPRRATRDLRLQAGDTVRIRLRRGGRDRDLAIVASARPGNLSDGRTIVIGPEELRERFGLRGDRIRVHVDSLTVHADSLHQRLRLMFRDSLGPRLRELEAIRIPDVEIFRARGDSALARARLRIMDGDSVIARALGSLPAGFDFALGARGVAGAEFSDLTPGLGSYFGADRGVLVLRVGSNTPAARAGLSEGDVVVRANGEQIASVRDLRRAVAAASNREVVLNVVRRGASEELRLRWD